MDSKRPRTIWLSDKEYRALQDKALESFEKRKGYLEAYLREIANAKTVLVIKGHGNFTVKQVKE